MRIRIMLDINQQLRRKSIGGNLLKWRVNNEFIKS